MIRIRQRFSFHIEILLYDVAQEQFVLNRFVRGL